LDELSFLDFLAHVPLFVMIHDSINHNPLDDNRVN